jgi:hypothetical protein
MMKANPLVRILAIVLALSPGLLASCAATKKAESAALEDPPIITSATYQHTLYNGEKQPIEARAAKADIAPLIVTYFLSEEAMLKNEGGFLDAPKEVGKYWVRIERPAGNGYRSGPPVKVEYFIQKPLGGAAGPAER